MRENINQRNSSIYFEIFFILRINSDLHHESQLRHTKYDRDEHETYIDDHHE